MSQYLLFNLNISYKNGDIQNLKNLWRSQILN